MAVLNNFANHDGDGQSYQISKPSSNLKNLQSRTMLELAEEHAMQLATLDKGIPEAFLIT
jgi:hypothetical protein